MLSPVLAQQIAGETTEAIGHNVIITDAEGVVIGSGDLDRVGTFHEASLEVVRTQESAWHTPEQARALRGVRAGITLPLIIGQEAVGTVGITGSPRQVRRFGLLVRRQTEILLEESVLLRNRLQRERALEDLVTEVVEFDRETTDPDLLAATARELGFTLTAPRVPALVEVDGAAIGPELLRTVRAVFHLRQDIVAMRSTARCQVLMFAEATRSPDREAKRLVESVEERFDVRVRVALAEPTDTLAGLAAACQDAVDALELGARALPGSKILRIRELRVHQALAAMTPHARQRLVGGGLGDLPARPDWPVLRATVIAWVESGFNLVDAAQTLRVHRNTLVYRLDKLEQLLGHPWRDHRVMLTVYLAALGETHADTGSAERPRRSAGGRA